MATTAQMENLSEKGLRETRAAMGADASLLKYLPIDKIYEAVFEDKKRERPNSLPLRILFGQLQEGDKKGEEVWILLNKSCAEDRWPEHRFNVFDRTGRLLGGITVEDAMRQSNPANAFKCLKPSGTMDIAHLRAVIKYYFMIKKVDPMMPWPVDNRFASQLIAACKAARKFAERVANINNNQTEIVQESANNAALQRVPSMTAQQAAKTNTPTNQLRAGTTTPATGSRTSSPLTRLQSMPHRTSMRSASTQPTRPMLVDDDDSLFISEQPRRAATPQAFKPHVRRTASTDLFSESEHVEEYKRAFQKKMLPQPASTQRSPPSGPRSSSHSFAVHQDASRVNTTAPSATPRPVSEGKNADSPLAFKAIKRQKDCSSQHQSPIAFVAAFRKADAEGESFKAKLQDNNAKLREIKAEIAVLETRLRDLEAEERNLKAKHKDTQMSKKRLHDELTPENRELLRFGVELAEREFKRPKIGAHEHVDGDEWRITQELGCGQKE